MPATATDFHHNIATDFADKYRTHPAFRERYAVWTALLSEYIAPGQQVLDLGCGSGVFSFFLAEKGCVVTGLDGAENMISLCRSKQEQQPDLTNLRFFQAHLPLNHTHSFPQQDAVISSSVLEYVSDLPAVLKDVSDLLPSGGLFIASMPNRSSIYRRLEHMIFQLTGHPAYYRFVRHVVTEKAFAKQLAAYGFRLKATRYYAGRSWLRVIFSKKSGCDLFVSVFEKIKN